MPNTPAPRAEPLLVTEAESTISMGRRLVPRTGAIALARARPWAAAVARSR